MGCYGLEYHMVGNVPIVAGVESCATLTFSIAIDTAVGLRLDQGTTAARIHWHLTMEHTVDDLLLLWLVNRPKDEDGRRTV